MSVTGTAVLLKFDLLQSVENCIKSVYNSNYSTTLWFQGQFFNKNAFRIQKAQLKMHITVRERKMYRHRKKYHQGPKKEKKGAK